MVDPVKTVVTAGLITMQNYFGCYYSYSYDVKQPNFARWPH